MLIKTPHDDYDCCKLYMEDQTTQLRLHYHKTFDRMENQLRQLKLTSSAGRELDMNFVLPDRRRECDG